MAHHGEYRQWPCLNEEEFQLAAAYFDRKYISAELGPTRRVLRINVRRSLTGAIWIEIIRLLQPPEDPDDLIRQLERLSGGEEPAVSGEMDIEMGEEDDEEALRPSQTVGRSEDVSPPYSLYSQQPYVTYEIHLHPTYQLPTLWFTLHDLPNGDSALDIDSVYRHLVPEQYKSQLRALGVMGGISAAHHPVTDVPAFFIHPCQTQEAMQCHDCPIEEYLMTWIGLVGGCVGLWMPSKMAQVNVSGQ